MRETYKDDDAQAQRCMRCVYGTLIAKQDGETHMYCPFGACIYDKEGENGCEQRENSKTRARSPI